MGQMHFKPESNGFMPELPGIGGLLSVPSAAVENFLLQQAMELTDTLVGYKELMMMYSCAMRSVQVRFETLDSEFNVRNRRNPIHSINTRLKSNSSIMEKLVRKELPPTLENIEGHIQDIAGVRVICSYVDDIYLLADALIRQDDIILLKKKDYISGPKPNGYRSLHLIVSIPVYFANQKKYCRWRCRSAPLPWTSGPAWSTS